MNTLTMPQVTLLTSATLKIMLPFRQWYEVRVKGNYGVWSSWTAFKTRDKTYVTPVAIYTSRAEFDTSPTEWHSKRIVVTRVGKTEERDDRRPATRGRRVFVNSDLGYNDTTSIVYTAEGATVTNSN